LLKLAKIIRISDGMSNSLRITFPWRQSLFMLR
jgi:hypothetical protein